MDLSLSSFARSSIPPPLKSCNLTSLSNFPNYSFKSRNFSLTPLISRQNRRIRAQYSCNSGSGGGGGGDDDGFVVDEVPHLTNFLPDLPVIRAIIVVILRK
ncbi:hypothetical protein CK203_058159 [Vitis vinifera]|uniref:Uncharacterized protein n=1 Tax=Vitis vinifera TaxID=29760 RepID=A0A438GQF2_VITVI|nr:hypothetical protein CK203_058159 [Vitis vinifera]